MVLQLRGANLNAVCTWQLFLRKARWNGAPILTAHRSLVAATPDEGVLAMDSADIPKDGTESMGIVRQDCGQLGKRVHCQARVWPQMLASVAQTRADGNRVSLDPTHVRGHVSAVGWPDSAEGQAQGRSRGGYGTQLHILVETAGRMLAFLPTLG